MGALCQRDAGYRTVRTSNREKEFPRLLKAVLNELLKPGQPLMGHGWGVADYAVNAYLAYLPMFFTDLDSAPRVWAALPQATGLPQGHGRDHIFSRRFC